MEKKTLSKGSLDWFIQLHKESNVILEGPVLKYIDTSAATPEQVAYLQRAAKDDEARTKRRMAVNRAVQRTNKELAEKTARLEEVLAEAELARSEAEHAKTRAENAEADALQKLDAETKRNQFAMMQFGAKVLLFIVAGVNVFAMVAWVVAAALPGEDTVMANILSQMLSNTLIGALSILSALYGIEKLTKKDGEGGEEEQYKASAYYNDPPAV